jgi:putative lipoic acid-binding regulatory protein
LSGKCGCKIHNPIHHLASNNLSMIKRKCHMRLKMNIMMKNHSSWRKKLPKNVQKYGKIHYTCRPKRKNSPKGTFNKWTLDLTGDSSCKIHNPIQH